MGRRRRSRPKNPRRGPGHNEQNRQTRESRQRTKMLDGAQETRFRYYMEQIIVESGLMADEDARPIIQGLWTQGFRNTIDDAKEWLDDRIEEGALDPGAKSDILRLVDKYSRWR